jgi:hypothetical protein
MAPHHEPFLVEAVKRLVKLLVAGNERLVEQVTKGVRLSSAEIRAALREYGGTLVMPPDAAFEKLDAIEVEGSRPRRWSVRFDLWTKEEGASDLSMELTIVASAPEPVVELDNFHVL